MEPNSPNNPDGPPGVEHVAQVVDLQQQLDKVKAERDQLQRTVDALAEDTRAQGGRAVHLHMLLTDDGQLVKALAPNVGIELPLVFEGEDGQRAATFAHILATQTGQRVTVYSVALVLFPQDQVN